MEGAKDTRDVKKWKMQLQPWEEGRDRAAMEAGMKVKGGLLPLVTEMLKQSEAALKEQKVKNTKQKQSRHRREGKWD